ncbi:MAG: carboxypeptidase-like regulatory domain-containing protein [Dysgonamonadaceae bacterium]|nr:carboxypeptidase-like regulatory domain-containing protein [Dysgonamonadaceae bacterium]
MNKRHKMTRTAFAFFFFLFALSSFSQQEINGRVLYMQTRKPVVSASVTLHPVGSKSILAYTVTAKDGSFTLKHGHLPDSVTLTVSAMTIERQSKTLKSNAEAVELLVAEKAMELEEVVVKAPKIRQTGDTLNYSVSSFTDETDRNIGDVLKKLPGVQVLSSGQILYQNKAISRFYIEGLDLLKGKYSLATQNVDASKVATVQIWENHQPIKALKDMDIPETAAINLKLKDAAIGAFFATAQAGAGLPPVLLSNEAVGMRFTRSQQNMLVYKGDDTGRDISRELTAHYNTLGDSQTNFLSVIAPSAPSIKEQHFLFNDAHIASLNDLRSLKKDLTLTSGINFMYDRQKSSSLSKQEIFPNQSDTIRIQEDMDARLLKRELDGSFVLEENTDTRFLNNTLRFKGSWNTKNSGVTTDEPITQYLKQPSFHIANEFEYILRKNDKRNSVKARVEYISQQHSLRVSPMLFEDLQNDDSLARQEVSLDRFSAEASLSRNKNIKRISIGYTTRVSFNRYLMESNLYPGFDSRPPADSVQNRLCRSETRFIVSPSISYLTPSAFYASLSFPINYLVLNRNDKVRDIKQNEGHLLFFPFFVTQYPFNSRICFSSNLSFSNDIASVNEDYLGYILTSYRSMNRNDGLLPENRRTSAIANLSYKNPNTTLFMYLQLGYDILWQNMLYGVNYNGILSSRTNILHPNTSHNYRIGYSLGKSIDAINSEVKITGGYLRSTAIAMNQGQISDYSSDLYSLSSNITTNISRKVIFKHEASYQQIHSKIRDNKMSPVNYFSQDISTALTPLKKLTFTLSFNHYFNDMIESSARSSWFGNVRAKYRMKNVDLMLDWTNIFNTKRFVTASYSDISSYYAEYSLRPAEILLRLRFKIF